MTPLEADSRRWVAWRNERRGDGGKPTKIPYCSPQKKARADDPATWLCRAEAERVASQIVNGLGGGIGYELGDVGGDLFIAGLDLDACLNGEVLADWAKAILTAISTYTEVSPSGTGLKLFFYVAADDVRPFLDLIGVDPQSWGSRRTVPGEDGRNHGPGVEIYFANRFFAVTGQLWPGLPARIELFDWETLQRLAALIPPPKSAASPGKGATGDNSRSAVAFGKGAALRRNGATFDQMVEALRSDPETAAWVREKGLPYGMRGLHRIWNKAAPSDDDENEDWGDPDLEVLRQHRRPPPTLPLALFGQPWAKWITDAARAAACPPDYVMLPLLAAVSVLIGHARWAQAGRAGSSRRICGSGRWVTVVMARAQVPIA